MRSTETGSRSKVCKREITKHDYVTPANAIPDASAANNVECFRETLAGDLVHSSDAKRKLYALNGGALRLELAVTIHVLRTTRVATVSSRNY
ncbi:hypothetical protein PI124_g2701 [Phytophthora idaei]|nr:hypothetical protein PI125_g12613 [Phytophthora idaei]KAG3252732.1 hypothetical protein PI124_g2701 [Phytophthora idaei]